MKKIIYALAVALSATGLTACSDDEPAVEVTDSGTVTDSDGNEYGWVRIGDLLWTTSNALNGSPLDEAEYFNNWEWETVLNSDDQIDYYYDEFLPEHGNLMTYAEAVASAPDGWRLPTDEDWQKLESALGLDNPSALNLRGSHGLELMNKDSGCRMGLSLSGSVVPTVSYGTIVMELERIGEYGYYWTSTLDSSHTDQEQAFYRRITANFGAVGRNSMTTSSYLSVRWVKDAGK